MPHYAQELAELMPEGDVGPRQGVGVNVRRLVKLRGRAMALVFVLVLLPWLAATYLLVPKFFVAEADIKFAATTEGILDRAARPLTGGAYEIFVNTEVEYLASPSFVDRMLASPRIKGEHSVLGRREDARLVVMNRFEVQPVRQTEVVQLRYKDVTREDALLVMNTVLETYRDVLRQRATERGGFVRQRIEANLAAQQEELENDIAYIAQLRRERGIPVGSAPGLDPAETEGVRANLTLVETDLLAARTSRQQAETLRDRAQGLLEGYQSAPSEPVYAMGVETQVSQHPSVTFLAEQMAGVQQQYSVIADRYVDDAPQTRVAKRELEAVEAEVGAQRTAVRGEILRSLVAQHQYDMDLADQQVAEAEARRDQLLGQLSDLEAKALERSGAREEIAQLEAGVEAKRLRIEQLRTSLFQLEMETDAPAQITVPEQAWAAYRPDQRQRIKYAMIGLFVAASLGIGCGLLIEAMDQNIRSGEDVRAVTRHPVVAGVPHASEDRLPAGTSPARVCGEYPDSMSADEYRRAAARVLTPGGSGPEIRSCLVTSPSRGDGRTTAACNLAIVLAQADRRVLLIDLNAHNPAVESLFGLHGGPGLGELLAGREMPHDPDQATEYENLFVIGPGLMTGSLLSRLASREMAEFLAGAEESFDHIIIDTPAALLTAEAKLLAPRVDGVLVVVGAGVSSFGMLRRTLALLDEAGGRVLGVLINQLRQSPFGYLRRNLNQYYDESRGHPRHAVVPGGARHAPARPGASIVLVDEPEDK